MGILNTAPALSLADLESFDPHGGRGNAREKRWRCPICQSDERALCANLETGAWNCKRASCGAKGKLKDFWQDRPAHEQRQERRARVRSSLKRAFALDEPRAAPGDETSQEWRAQLSGLRPLAGTPGEAYLSGRGIPCDLAHSNGVSYSPCWYGRPAVVFPICDRAGVLVAANGRYIDGRDNPKTRTAGPKSQGIFKAATLATEHARAFDPLEEATPAILITEAPIDALSTAAAGFPSLALVGTSGPAWLHLACGLRCVLMAVDADENKAGEQAAAALEEKLSPYGARCERLPPAGFKDWNEALQAIGAPALADFLAFSILP